MSCTSGTAPMSCTSATAQAAPQDQQPQAKRPRPGQDQQPQDILLMDNISPNDGTDGLRLLILDLSTLSPAEQDMVRDMLSLAAEAEGTAVVLPPGNEYFTGILEGWNDETFAEKTTTYQPLLHRTLLGVIVVSPMQ